MGKAQFTKIVTAFEHSPPCSAQEKTHQRSDLEAMVEQIEQDTFEFQVQELEETAQTAAQACGAGDCRNCWAGALPENHITIHNRHN